jgi:hypothetical protein
MNFVIFTIHRSFLTVPARSNCRERVHGVRCWSKPFRTDDFLPIGWMVGKSYGFHPPAPVVLFDCLHFVQCLLFNARDISNLSKILDAWSPVLCWSKFRFVFTVFYTDTNFTYWDNATQLKCCVILAYGACDVKKNSRLWREVGAVLFSFCWASPARPFSDLSPTGLFSIFYCLYFCDSRNLEGQVPVFISPRNRVAQLYPLALGLSSLSLIRDISTVHICTIHILGLF